MCKRLVNYLLKYLHLQEVVNPEQGKLGGPGFSDVDILEALKVVGLKSGHPEKHPDAISCDVRVYAGTGLIVCGDRSEMSAEYHELCYPVITNQ